MKEKAKGKKKIVILVIVLVILIAAGLLLFFVMRGKSNKNQFGEMGMPPTMEGMGEEIISASGLTIVGMEEESLALDFLETKLYVEESFLSMGDEVEAGAVVFRVSDETLKEARKELEDAVTEAGLAYRQGVLDYEVSFLEAKATYETSAVNQEYAQAEYDDAVSNAAAKVENLETQVEEARALVTEYEASETEDYYRTYYKVDELYNTYYEHFTLLMEKYEEWDIETLEDLYGNSVSSLSSSSSSSSGGMTGSSASSATGGSGGMGMSGGQSAGMGSKQNSGSSDLEQKYAVYLTFDEIVKQESEEYTTALENYEAAKEQATAGLEAAKSNLIMLEAELAQAQTTYEKELIVCKADYETTLAEGGNAQTVYDTTCQSLEEALDALQTEKEEAEENLAYFEEMLGDGNFYTTKAGTIVMNAVRENSYLSGDTMVIAYSNPETVTISANVDQSNIADISIGDEAMVVISEYGSYKGTVTNINPVTQASSRSSVTYQVTVTLEGDLSGLESNLTAYVYFGMTETEGMPESGEMPEREGMPESGEMPEREGMPEKGEMPGGESGQSEERRGAGNEGEMEKR